MRKFANAALWSASAALTLYALWALSPWATAGQIEVVAHLGLIVLSLLIAAGGFYVARTPAFPAALQRAWLFFLLGNLSAGVGAALWLLNHLVLGANALPWLSVAFNLLASSLFFGGILSLSYAPRQ